MRFSWNERKNQQNICKHGIDFNNAKEIFYATTIEWIDFRKSFVEERIIAVGYMQGHPIVIVYTQPEPDLYHIVSARHASKKEEESLVQSIWAGQSMTRKGRKHVKKEEDRL